jgi:hypothetical protein
MAEGKTLQNAVGVGPINRLSRAQIAAALWTLGLQQMPLAGAQPHYLAASGDFEPLGDRLLGLNASWASHITGLPL